MRRLARRLALLVLAATLPAGDTQAQQVDAGARVEAYGMTQSNDLRLRSIRLVTLPFGARVPLGSTAEFMVQGAYADARASLANGDDALVHGVIDTRVALEARAGGAVLRASALLPTGNVVSTATEAAVVGLLSTELLPFAISQWGTGGGVAGDLGYGGRVGETVLQLSTGATLLRESTPLTPRVAYAPGVQLRVRAIMESAIGTAGALSVLLGYQHFLVDEYGGRNIFQAGPRLEGAVSYAFPLGPRKSVLAYGGIYRLQGGVSQIVELDVGDLGAVLPGLGDRPPRTLFAGGGELRLARGRYVVAPRADVRVLRRADGIGQGWLASLGGRTEVRWGAPLGREWVIEPSLAARLGRLVAAGDVRSGILGGELAVAVRWGGR